MQEFSLFHTPECVKGQCVYFLALKYGKVSEVAPIDKLSVVFAVLLAVLLFGERVSTVHAVAIGRIALGGILLAVF